MKKNRLYLLLIFVTTFSFAAEKEPVKSTITDVTVYTQGAQVTRKATYSIKPGITEIILDGICPTIDPKSLQVKGTGNLIILDSKYSLYYPEPEPEKSWQGIPLKIQKDIRLLQDSITVVGNGLQDIQDELDVLIATKNILSNNGAIRGQGKVNDSIQLLKQTLEFYATKMLEISKQITKLNRQKTQLNTRKASMQLRLDDLYNYQNSIEDPKQPKGPIHRITVTVSSKELVTGKLTLSYLVSGAGWIPLYDLRSEMASGKVNLNYKAQVFQNSGTDWKDVKLTISTNNPYQNKVKPNLHPWYIDYYVARPAPGTLNANGYMAPAAQQLDFKKTRSADQEDVAYEKDAMTAANFTQVVDQLISAEFRIDLAYTILSNSEKHMVLISNTDLTANYKYYTVPKMDASVYLVAQISKLDELQLVPARANIFFDGSYIGETYIDPTTMEDTLSLSLGKDPNIVVKRTLLKKESKERIVANQKEKTNSFQIEIKNNKSSNVTVVVQDQIPVTQNASIQIEATEIGKAKLDEVTGLLEWEVSLKPKESKILKFVYKVKFDKDKTL